MAIRTLRYDDDEILKKVSKPIEKIDEKIKELARDMLETMYKSDGIGLAAIQVGFLKRMLVYDVDYVKENGKKNGIVVVNPTIIKKSKEMICTEEGCLSYPDMFGKVDRFEKITVRYTDLEGKLVEKTISGMEAVVFQHESDHLDGIIFLDKAYDIYRYSEREEKKNSKNKKKK